MTVRGIDVSRYQGIVDWAAVKASGLVDFAFIKLGGGDAGVYTDSKAQYNLQQARGNGVPFGVYWYFSGASTVAAQLERIKLLRPWFNDARLPFVIDLEADRPAQEILDGLALATALDLLGLSVMIYTGNWWWAPRWQQLAVKPSLGKVKLWQAAYQTAEPAPCAGWSEWTVWQKSSTGTVPGITGKVDLNEARTRFWEPVGVRRKVTADALNIRPGPIAAGTPMGVLVKGQEVEVEETVNGWHRLLVGEKLTVAASAGGATFTPTIGAPPRWLPAAAYISAAYTAPVSEAPPPPPPPVATGKMRLGVNVITGDAGVMNRALAAGCTAISGINMFGQLSDMAAQRPDVTFMARRYVSSMPPPDPDVVFEGAQSPHVWYLTPLNECDVQCNGTAQQIRERAAFDKTMFERMLARGRRYCGGGFSVGTAEYTNPEVVAAMREAYAPLYARGMGFNGHFYRPWRAHNPDQWYEGRWRFLFGTGPMECGFDPDPALAGIFSDEVGLDEGSLGGFSAAGWGAERVEAWCREFLSYSQSQPNGGLFRAAVIFQAGNKSTAPGGWAGYDVDTPDMLAAIGRAAQAPTLPWTPPATRQRAGATVAPTIQPSPRKVIAQYEDGI